MIEQKELTVKRSIPFKEQMVVLKRILKFGKPYKKQFALAIVFSLALAISTAALPRILQLFIDNHLTTGNLSLQIILMFAGLHFGVTLIRLTVWYFELYIFNMASERTVRNIRNQLFEKLHTLGMRF